MGAPINFKKLMKTSARWSAASKIKEKGNKEKTIPKTRAIKLLNVEFIFAFTT